MNRWIPYLLLLFSAISFGKEITSEVKNKGRVLIMGDSFLVGAFGDVLHQLLVDDGYTVLSSALCSSRLGTFFKSNPPSHCGYRRRVTLNGKVKTTIFHKKGPGENIESLYREFKPDIIVLHFGMNYYKAIASWINKHAKQLAELNKKYAVKTTLWMGTPNYYKQKFLETQIKEAVQPFPKMHYISGYSFNPKKPLPKKNVHLPPKEAGLWGKFVHDKLAVKMGELGLY